MAGMRKDDALKHFGTVKEVAEQLGISTQAVYSWPDIVPFTSASMLYWLSGEKLDLQLKDYRDDRSRTDQNPPQTP